MIVGREHERSVIRSQVSAARVGRSAVLVLTGEAGIGKTSLLEEAEAEAAATGMAVLRATGTESEADVPFGALLQLLRPALVHLDRIPAPQAGALASALALRPGTADDRFAVGAATLSLLSRFAEDRPVAVLVDDAHLLDLPSGQALTFAARRLRADPIAVLATARQGQPGPFSDPDLPALRVGGLTRAETELLVAGRGGGLDDDAMTRLYDLTGGNPLAVVELADDVDSLDPGPFGTPVPVPATLARAFARRADRLSGAGRSALLAAATGGGELDVLGRACRLLGVDVSALSEAEDAGLLSIADDQVVFRHGLVRSAVYSDATPGARRAVHRAFSQALPPHEADRRAWHLGKAALGPDHETALLLQGVAVAARARSAHAVASAVFDRAARLSPDQPDRLERLVAAGECAWLAGQADRAVALLAEAALLEPPPAARARIAGLRGAVVARTGSVETARDLLMAAAVETAGSDPDTAVLLFADAVLACFFLADVTSVVDAAALLDGAVRRSTTGRARLVGALAGGAAGVLAGRSGPEQIRVALQQVVATEELVTDPQVAPWLVLGPLFLRERGTGRELVQVVVDSVRRRSAVGALPLLLFHVGRDEATTDRWEQAGSTYAEGVALARETGQSTDLAACLAGLAWLEARQGREASCRAHAEEAALLCEPRHLALFQCWSLFAVGELELGLGRADAALGPLERLEALLSGLGVVDVDLSPAPELVDALIRVGRDGEASTVAARYASLALDKGQPWALARAARALGTTAPDDDLDGHFLEALEQHGRTLDSYERARTELSYGSRLRRLRRRVEARPPLRAALATFEALGATPWADQAAGELRATGETARRRGVSSLDGLTPQELQVARLLAGGRTTREAAAALFLSPKTVEYHLRHVYTKLDIASRAELAGALGDA